MRVSVTARSNFAGSAEKPGASRSTTQRHRRQAPATSSDDLHDQHQREDAAREGARRRLAVRFEHAARRSGTKAELNAPSPKMARKWLGMRNATTKASATGPAPITAAMTTSRTKPVTRETSVQPPTDRIFLNIGQARAQPAVVADERAARSLGGGADALGHDVKRPALHLGEDAADIFADDAERHAAGRRRRTSPTRSGWESRARRCRTAACGPGSRARSAMRADRDQRRRDRSRPVKARSRTR